MSWLSSLASGSPSYQNPADAAMPYLNQVPDYVHQYYDPYISNGLSAGQTNMSVYGSMASNPQQYYNNLYSGYNVSPYAQYQSDQMQKAATSAAASGGYAGTDSDIARQEEEQNAILSNDWNQYLSQVLGIQNTGLAGNQQMYNTGFNASNMSAEDLIGMLNAQAGLAYNSVNNQNAYNAQKYNNSMGALGTIAGYAMYPYGSSGSNYAPVSSIT